MELSLRTLRFRLQAAGVLPRTRLARAACYLLGLDLLLFALQKLFGLFKVSFGLALRGWVGILSFLAIILFALLAFRWLKAKLLWRLRNRLIVTYVFIGVIPVVLLVAMAFITHLSVCRTVREFRRHLRAGFAAAQSAIGECGHRPRTGGAPGTRTAGDGRIARRTEAQ